MQIFQSFDSTVNKQKDAIYCWRYAVDSIYKCDMRNRDCHTRIGLFCRSRCCSSRTDSCKKSPGFIFHGHYRLTEANNTVDLLVKVGTRNAMASRWNPNTVRNKKVVGKENNGKPCYKTPSREKLSVLPLVLTKLRIKYAMQSN